MSWEYIHLRRQLELPDSEWSAAFERFCAQAAWRTEGRLEWSVRVSADRLLVDRFVWSGANSPDVSGAAAAAETRAHFDPELIGRSPEQWRRLREEQSTAISFGYTPGDTTVSEPAGLKLYLTLMRALDGPTWSWIRELLPDLPTDAPPRPIGLIVAFAISAAEAIRPRLYLLADGPDCNDPAVARYLGQWLEPDLLKLGADHLRTGVVVRDGGVDCFGCAFQPAGMEAPSGEPILSPVLPGVIERIADCPEAFSRISRLTWVTFALTGPERPPYGGLRNAYFLLD